MDAGMSEDVIYRRVTPVEHKQWRFGNSVLVPAFLGEFFLIYCSVFFNDELALCRTLLIVEIWRWNGVHWTLWFILSLVEGLFKDARSIWKHPLIQSAAAFSLTFFYEEQSALWGYAVELLWRILSIGNSKSWSFVWVLVYSCVSQHLLRCFLLTSL